MKKSKVLKSGDFSEGAFHTWHLLGECRSLSVIITNYDKKANTVVQNKVRFWHLKLGLTNLVLTFT